MLAFMSPSTAKTERRKRTRKRPPTLVYVELSSANGGMMRDLSEDGFSVRAMMPLHAGETTPFSFALTASERVEGEGKIQWIEENGRVAGVQFTQISNESRTLIREWLKRPAASRDAREAAPDPPPAAKSPEQLFEELQSTPAREEKTEPDAARAREKAPELPVPVMEAPPRPAPPPSAAPVSFTPVVHPTVPVQKPVEPVVDKAHEAAAIPEPLPPVPPPVVVPAVHAVAPEEKPTGQVVEKAPEATAIPKPPTHPVPPSVASALHLAVPAEKPKEPVVERVEKAGEPPPVRDLPKLILPRVDFGASEPTIHGPEEKTSSVPEETVKPTEAAVTQQGQEGEAELPGALPDISTILMQPSGKHGEPGPRRAGLNSLPSLAPLPETLETERRPRFTLTSAITIMCLLALLVGIYAYHREVGRGLIWLGKQMGGAEEKNSPSQTPDDKGSANAPSEPPSKPSVSEEKSAVETPPSSQESPASSPDSNHTVPPVTPLSGIGVSSPGAEQEPGQNEYLQAMELLHGNNPVADTSAAVRLLWASVEQGNPNAEISLADMYWRGQGVAKNCDQARILLTAAARKGSGEGKKRLQQFQQAGCE